MTIVDTLVPGLHAFRYEGQVLNELERLFDLWQDTEYLNNFFEKYQDDLKYYGVSIEQATNETKIYAKDLEEYLLDLSPEDKNGLIAIFKPLDDREYKVLSMSKQKSRKQWLRLYAIQIEGNLFVLTGGAIKLTHKMKDRPHTQKELDKLEQCRNFLKAMGVFDTDSFHETEF